MFARMEESWPYFATLFCCCCFLHISISLEIIFNQPKMGWKTAKRQSLCNAYKRSNTPKHDQQKKMGFTSENHFSLWLSIEHRCHNTTNLKLSLTAELIGNNDGLGISGLSTASHLTFQCMLIIYCRLSSEYRQNIIFYQNMSILNNNPSAHIQQQALSITTDISLITTSLLNAT